jgi:putative peptide zinc metalloprotease protein
MTRIARFRALLAALCVAAAVAGAPAGAALAAQGDTSAVAVNTTDGSSVFKLTFQIVRVVSDTVDQSNTAIAYSSCNECQTVAISIQILLVQADLTSFTPVNQAIAINENCTSCDTLASAYQFAVGVGDKLKFTAGGHQQLEAIRKQLRELRDSGLSGPDLQARVSGLMTQLGDVLRTELTGVNEPAGRDAAPSDSAPAASGTTPTATDTTPSSTDTTPSSTDTTPQSTDTPPTDTTPSGATPTDTTPTTTDTTPSSTDTTPTDTTAAPPPSG